MHMYACMGLDKENNRKHEITETQKALQINYREAGLHDDHCMHPASSTAQFFVKKKNKRFCVCVSFLLYVLQQNYGRSQETMKTTVHTDADRSISCPLDSGHY